MTVEGDPRNGFMQRRLRALRGRRLDRHLTALPDGAETWTTVQGQTLLNLSSNNYLGLATHPEVKAAAAEAAGSGTSSGSSRLIAGTSPLHQHLEEALARFKGTEGALLFNSGYTANIGIIPALVGQGDVVLSDELNHASLIDGCRLSRAEYRTYPHCDLAALEAELAPAARRPRGRRLVVTDTVFSMDGDIAPLEEIAALCTHYDALLLVDEAHGTGCLGPRGRGLVAHLGLEDQVTVAMSTLSKALGSFGAFVTGNQLVADYLLNVTRSFIFSTALPPAVVAASIAALRVLEREPGLVDRLEENSVFFRHGLQALGLDTLGSCTHIVPVLVGDSERALQLAEELRAEGIFAVAIRPPTVPMGAARVRATVMATHERQDLCNAVQSFGRAARRIDLI